MALLLTILVSFLAVFAGVYKLYIAPALVILGFGRVIHPLGNADCTTVPELQACEKVVLHQATGVIYLACSTLSSRPHWLPIGTRFNVTGKSKTDYVATYDPLTKQVTRLETPNFTSERGLSLHGMDVVPSEHDPEELFVYLVNHRIPKDNLDPVLVGADSAIEIFRTTVGSKAMTHIKTVEDPVIIAPNDIAGSATGKSFFFTNDHGSKVGQARDLLEFIKPSSSVGYCDIDRGCKFAATGMYSNNGIASNGNDTVYVSNALSGKIRIFEKQADNTLILTDTITTDRVLDNLTLDHHGHLWILGIPKLEEAINHMKDPSKTSPSSALRLSLNTGPSAFYGVRTRLEKVFEDDGSLVSGATSVVYDSQRNRLFLHGLASPWLTVCKYP